MMLETLRLIATAGEDGSEPTAAHRPVVLRGRRTRRRFVSVTASGQELYPLYACRILHFLHYALDRRTVRVYQKRDRLGF